MVKQIFKKWDEFWFSQVSLFNLALFRIMLCGTMFVLYLNRQKDLDFFFTDKGLVPKNLALEIMPEFLRPTFSWYFWPDSSVHVMHTFFVLGLFLLTVGFGGRLLSAFIWILHMGFIQRNFAIEFGADQVSAIFLFYLCFTQSCEELSLQQWLRHKFGKIKNHESDILTSVFYRMIQVQLCVIYAYAGMEKLKGATWWDGTAIWSVLANSQMVTTDFTWLRQLPWVIAILTFSTLLFEIYFPVLVWLKSTRIYMLIGGTIFHLGISLVMALHAFTAIMIAPYILFIPDEVSCKIKLKLTRS